LLVGNVPQIERFEANSDGLWEGYLVTIVDGFSSLVPKPAAPVI
jgi:hypothetical protein